MSKGYISTIDVANKSNKVNKKCVSKTSNCKVKDRPIKKIKRLNLQVL